MDKILKVIKEAEALKNEMKSTLSLKEFLSYPFVQQEVKARLEDVDTATAIVRKLQELEGDTEFIEDEGFEFEMDPDFFGEDIPDPDELFPDVDEDHMNDVFEKVEEEVLDLKPQTGFNAVSALSTKTESYLKIKPTTSILHQRILTILKHNHNLTRREIAKQAKISLSSACARVKELLDSGEIVKSGKAYDCTTDRNVETLAIRKTK